MEVSAGWKNKLLSGEIQCARYRCSFHFSPCKSGFKGWRKTKKQGRSVVSCRARQSTAVRGEVDLRAPLLQARAPENSTAAATEAENGIAREIGSTDTSLRSTLEHRLWVLAGCSSLLATLAKSLLATLAAQDETLVTALATLAAALSGYALADLATGVYHWGIDNYGDAATPIFGAQIDAFQGHHKRPWTITKRDFANNIHALARPTSIFLLPVVVATPGNAPLDAFLGVFLGCVMFSQQFHCWAHMRRSQLPAIVRELHDSGVLVSTRDHGRHHRQPFDSNYCIVSGLWNRTLDSTGALKLAEDFIYRKWGYAARCWQDSAPEWSQEGSYFED